MNQATPCQSDPQLMAVIMLAAFFLVGWFFHLTSSSSVKTGADTSETLASPPVVVWQARQQDVLELANSTVARNLRIRPDHYSKIAQIDSELDRTATEIIEQDLKRWQNRGGFHMEPLPNFRNQQSPYGQKLVELRKRAEARILNVLSDEERRRWNSQKPRMRTLSLPNKLCTVRASSR
jgi:hypothetical protein